MLQNKNYLNRTPSNRQSLFLAEYNGQYPDSVCHHGNLKSNESEYVNIQINVVDEMRTKRKLQKPRQVYSAMTLDSCLNSPRDVKQEQNIKYNQS